MKRIFALSAALALLCCLFGGCAGDLAANDRGESLPRVTSNVTASPEPDNNGEDNRGSMIPGMGPGGASGNAGNSGNGSSSGNHSNGNSSSGPDSGAGTGSRSGGNGGGMTGRSGGAAGGSSRNGDQPGPVIGRNADGTNYNTGS